MNDSIIDFYTGFEGEKEIQFIRVSNDNKHIIKMWSGYFDDMMEKIEPEPGGWMSLALYYHVGENWVEGEHWVVPDLEKAKQQLKQIENEEFEFQQTKDVLSQIYILLNSAIECNDYVKIAEE